MQQRNTKRSCAFCGRPGRLTREHVMAAFIQSRTARRIRSNSIKIGTRIAGGASTVRDVCADCNNRRLSQLDQYASTLYDRFFNRATSSVCGELFRVSRDRLLRWLLKVSYNAARSDASGEAHVAFAPYILGDRNDPPFATDLLLGLLASSSKAISVFLRSGELQLPHIEPQLTLHRFVAINHFVFGIISWQPGVPRPFRRRFLKEFCEYNHHVLVPRQGFARLRPSVVSEEFWRSIVTGETRFVPQLEP